MAFKAGYDCDVTFGGTALNVTKWTNEDGGVVLDVTHAGTAGKAACLPGVGMHKGTVNANVNIAALPSGNTPAIKFGAKGTLTLSVGTGTPFSIGIMVTRVNWSSEVNGLVSYSFDFQSDYITATSVTYPAP